MLSRRTLIGKAAVGAAAAVALGAARKGVAAIRAPRVATTGNAPNDHGVDGVPPSAAPLSPSAETSVISSPAVVEAATVSAPPPWELLRPLTAGAKVAHGWRVTELSPVRHGACVVTLTNARGRSHRVHICRNDGTPRGLVYTRRLDLVVMNGGRSDLPTEEGFAQAVARLAHVVAKNERRVAVDVFAELLPHTERMERFAGAQLR
jgi:hypothetical protein